MPRGRRTARDPQGAPLADWNYTGLLFENMALRDVRVYLEEGAESLTQFIGTVNLRSAGQPSFLAVLTGANVYATRRPDGIDVIPIAALGP